MKVLLPVIALLFAQSQQTAPTFLETLEVRVTNVDVVVTDAYGKPVRGLGRGDFALLEDGVPQPITNFAEYSGSKGVAVAPGTPMAPAAETVAAPPPRKFLFFIDDMSLSNSNKRQLIESATALVRDEMRAGDEAMVVMRANATKAPLAFSTDRAAIEAQLREALEKTKFRANTDARAEELFLQSARPTTSREYLRSARMYATRVNRRVTSTLRTLLGLVGSLNETTGRKVLVVVSESLPAEPGREAYGMMTIADNLAPTTVEFGMADSTSELPESVRVFDASETSARAAWFDVRPMIRELAARAGANGVTIYTLQPDFAGAVEVSGGSADRVGRIGASPQGQSVRGGTFAVNQLHRQTLEETRHTLLTLAQETGGKFFIGGGELAGGFRQIAEDLTSYYSLGYRSGAKANNSVKRIEVRVKNHADFTVRARREMLQRTPEREMQEIVAANLIAPRRVNELGISASAGRPERKFDSYVVPIVVKIPLSKLTFIPDGDKYRAAFSVHYAIADGRDYTTGLYREQGVEIPAKEIDAMRQKDFTYTANLNVAPGTLKVAVGVYDRYSRLAGFQQVEVVAR